MRSALVEHHGVIPDLVPPTDLPHLRRCIAAGLLVRLHGGGWVPTEAGRDALRTLDDLPRENPYHPRNPKIDLFDKRTGQYLASTHACRTVREAVATAAALRNGHAVTGRIDRGAR
jgi:hypothetical protein